MLNLSSEWCYGIFNINKNVPIDSETLRVYHMDKQEVSGTVIFSSLLPKKQLQVDTMVDDFKKYLSVKDIAKKFGVTDEWIRDLIQAGKIRATKIGSWRVKPEDLEKFIKSRRNY
jgi:excisionase family DNA binding protein